MSNNELLNRAIQAIQQFKKPRTNCWCDRDNGPAGDFPANGHTVACMDMQQLEADLAEAIR